jgi:hypothetical protein
MKTHPLQESIGFEPNGWLLADVGESQDFNRLI